MICPLTSDITLRNTVTKVYSGMETWVNGSKMVGDFEDENDPG